MKRLLAVTLSAGIAIFLTACSGAGGGATSCGSFEGMSSSDRLTTVQNMMKSHQQDMSADNLQTTIGSVDFFCALHPSDTEISGIYSG
jgi:hypothetical protein